MSDESPDRELTPEERLATARDAFEKSQRFLPPGVPQVVEPPQFELMATVNALASVLRAKDLIGEQELVDAKTLAWAELMEQLVDAIGEMKRNALAATLVQAPGQRL